MRKTRDVVAASLEAFNDHDERRIRALYADDVILEAPGELRCDGAEAATRYLLSWLRAFPDARIRVETEVANGDWVAQRLLFEGTHEETWIGPEDEVPATGRRVRIAAVQLVRVSGGRIAEAYLSFDQAQVLAELGLVPELAARA